MIATAIWAAEKRLLVNAKLTSDQLLHMRRQCAQLLLPLSLLPIGVGAQMMRSCQSHIPTSEAREHLDSWTAGRLCN